MTTFEEAAGVDDGLATSRIVETIMSAVHVAMPCVLLEDSDGMTCHVRPTIQAVVVDPKTGTRSFDKMTDIRDCPVVFPCGGGFTLTFPLKAGDEVLLLFADRGIDGWWSKGGIQPPQELRKHSLHDGFVIPGVRSMLRALTNISTTTTQLRSDDGLQYVETAKDSVSLVSESALDVSKPTTQRTRTRVKVMQPAGVAVEAEIIQQTNDVKAKKVLSTLTLNSVKGTISPMTAILDAATTDPTSKTIIHDANVAVTPTSIITAFTEKDAQSGLTTGTGTTTVSDYGLTSETDRFGIFTKSDGKTKVAVQYAQSNFNVCTIDNVNAIGDTLSRFAWEASLDANDNPVMTLRYALQTTWLTDDIVSQAMGGDGYYSVSYQNTYACSLSCFDGVAATPLASFGVSSTESGQPSIAGAVYQPGQGNSASTPYSSLSMTYEQASFTTVTPTSYSVLQTSIPTGSTGDTVSNARTVNRQTGVMAQQVTSKYGSSCDIANVSSTDPNLPTNLTSYISRFIVTPTQIYGCAPNGCNFQTGTPNQGVIP